MNTEVKHIWSRTLSALYVAMTVAVAAPPDLTSGGVPNEDPALTFNLGPTGMRGWAYHVKIDTSESRQILVTNVDSGSPADGILAVDDVILGASGTGSTPVNFSSDARKSLAYAIQDAEARNPAELKLLRWRGGSTSAVTITLQNLGAYTATAPYSCPKSALILQNGLQYVYNNEDSGRYSFGAITLLANGNATYEAKAQTEARALIPSQATMDQMMSDAADTSSMITWQRGHVLVFLAEYYLATNDAQVLPAIEAYAVNIAKNQSLFGTVGHKYAQKWPDGSHNGPMGGVYGVVNSAGMPCFLGVLLAKECGLTNPELDPAIEASSRFFAYYTGKGAIPYGEHEPYIAHESNGKCGLGALYFGLQNNRVEEGKFFAKMATASFNERELGHTGSWFNYLWAPLGAAAGGEEAAAAHFSRISWMLDLNRCWDGRFQYDCLNGEGPNNGSEYNNFRMSTAALLTYALPLRKLRITGKNHDSARYLSSSDVTEAVQSGGYDPDPRSDSQLISDLSDWSPKVRKLAAQELGTRSINTSELNQITAIANDTNASSHSRAGACAALGEIGNSSSAAHLAALLTDADNYVRYSAGDAMRYLPRSANLAHVDTILEAAASTAAPLYPMVEEDPLQFAHAKLGMLLFYSWSAFGPKGILWDSVDGVDRSKLYPAIEAIAKTPVGLARGTLERTYDNLNYTDVLALSGTIVDSVVHRAPADKMFSNGVRRGGVAVLQKHGIAEGVPASMAFTADEEGGRRREGLEGIGTFGGGVHSVEPDPDAVGFLTSYLSIGEVAATAQASLDAINNDSNPIPLTALKSIQSANADSPTLYLPSNSTVLRVSATDHAKGDSIYTWTKVSGSGAVTFTPNGTAAAADSTVQFDGTVGVYEFEVTMSDSRGLTEAYETVTVTVLDDSGPDSTPPTLAGSDIVDNKSGGQIFDTDTVVYTVTFSEPMDGSTIGTADFENGGSPEATIDSVASTSDPAVFEVSVTPGGTGTLQLQVKSGTNIEDLAGNALNTTSAIADDTTITVTAAPPAASILAFSEGNGSSGGGDKTIATAYDASAASKLVVVLGGEHGFPGNSGGGFNSVTYGGVALTEAVQEEAGVPTIAIFYLDNPGAAGDIVVNQENHNGTLYAIYQLTGTASGAGATNKAAANSVNLTTTAGNSIVIAGILNAGPDGGNGAPNMTADAPLTEDTLTDLEAGSRYVSMSAGSTTVATPSVGNYSFSNAGGTDLLAIAAVEFTSAAAPPDTTPPTLASTDIVDDQGGGNISVSTLVTYTVTFSEDIDDTTVQASDFANAGSSSITIGSISETSPGVFTVEVTPTNDGTLQLEVPSGATISDVAGNALNTSTSIGDDTTLIVGTVMVTVPDVVGMSQATAQSTITSAGLSVGTVTTAASGSVPFGDVISQSPVGGTSSSSGSPVDLVISSGNGNPLKVFILAGQSNMEGHGEKDPVGTQGTLEYLVSNDATNYGHLKNGVNWATRNDVWMWYKRGGTTQLNGDLSADFGVSNDTIGPELQFGHVIGDAYGEQVLIIKTAWGGKSLAVDFRPPTSGWSVNPPVSAGDQGYYYQEMMNYVNDVLTNLSTYFPGYNAANGYQLAGFGWHQGWNDRVNQTYNNEYEANMKNFIDDVRSDLGVPGLPFVIATTGMSGWSETHHRALSLMNAQLAMEDFTKYPSFNGNVAVVETRDFWRDSSVSPANQNYHWNRNAETYCLIGQAMAQEMLSLISNSSPTFGNYIVNPLWGLAMVDWDPDDDPDKDGLSNHLEAWLGTHPGERNAFVTSMASTATTVTFTHSQNTNLPTDLTGHYEWSPNLTDWYTSGNGPAGGPTVSFSASTSGAETTVTATSSAAFGRVFLRAVVNTN